MTSRTVSPRFRNAIRSLVLLLLAGSCQAQVFQLQGGTSTLFQASGGSLNVHGPGYDGWLGAGSIDGRFRLGGLVQTRVLGLDLKAGDDLIRLDLPTDVFDSGQFFLSRGIGISAGHKRTRAFLFAGSSTSGFGAPFFRAAKAETPVSAAFLDSDLSPRLVLFTRAVFSERQTFLQGLWWKPRDGLAAGLAGGVGAGAGYLSASTLAERQRYTLKLEYVITSDSFRRFAASTPSNTEVDRENIWLQLRPSQRFSFGGLHGHVRLPLTASTSPSQADVDQLFAQGELFDFRLGASLYRSQGTGQHNLGLAMNASRRLGTRLEAGFNAFSSRPQSSAAVTSYSGTLRETISSRLSLLQVVTHSSGSTTIAFGGNLAGNRLSLGVDYQTVYLPLAPGNPFKNVLAWSIRLRPFGNTELNANSFVSPDGKVRYSIAGRESLYRYSGLESRPQPTLGIPKYIVHGTVVDESGRPLLGAALRIDGVIAYSDREGRFFVRLKRKKKYPFQVLLDEFLVPGAFQVQAAPTTVLAQPEESAPELTIVIARIPVTASRK